MTHNEQFEHKMIDCRMFFDELADILRGDYEVVESCNNDLSAYLIPKGSRDDLTYYGKPKNSFRVSDHWSWYSTLEKCDVPDYIQCYSVDMPHPKPRPDEGVPTRAIIGAQVCLTDEHGNYHVMYGEAYDAKTNRWTWVWNTPEHVAKYVKEVVA